MRMLFLLTLAGIGCAAAQPKPIAKADLNRCSYVGPSEVIYYRQQDPSYRVVNGKLYSCPAT